MKPGIKSSNLKSDGTRATGSNSFNVYGGFKADHFRLERDFLSSVSKPFTPPLAAIENIAEGISVNANELFKEGTISIYSLMGHSIIHTPITKEKTCIKVSSPGIYFDSSLKRVANSFTVCI